MEISTLKIKFQDAKEFELLNPITNQPSGAFLTIASINSKLGKAVQLEIFRESAKLKTEDKFNEDSFKEIAKPLLAKLIVGWRGLTKDGKEYKFNEKNAIDLVNSDTVYDFVNFNAGFQANFIIE